MKSGSFKLLEPSGPVQACHGIALPLFFACTATLSRQVDFFRIRLDDIDITRKAIRVQAWTGPEFSKSFRIPDFKTIDKVVTPTHRLPLPRQEIFLVLVSLRGRVKLQGHSAAGRINPLKTKHRPL